MVKNKKGYPSRWTFYFGPDGKLLHIDKKVKTGSHGDDIVKKLEELEIPARNKQA